MGPPGSKLKDAPSSDIPGKSRIWDMNEVSFLTAGLFRTCKMAVACETESPSP